MQWWFDVKIQADKHVRRDVAERLNRKQRLHLGENNGLQIHGRKMGKAR